MAHKPLPPELLATKPYLADDPTAQHPKNGPPVGNPPPKYTQGLHEAIIANIKKFNRPVTAAHMAGITSAMFYDWMKRGRDGDPHLIGFADDVERAQGVAEGRALEVVTEAFVDDPEHAKWYLERTRGAGFSKEVNAKVEALLADMIQRLRDELPPEMYKAVLSVMSGQGIQNDEGPSRFQLSAPKPDNDDNE